MKPITALIILDGFGYREEKEYNAILTAAWTWACPGARWATARWAI